MTSSVLHLLRILVCFPLARTAVKRLKMLYLIYQSSDLNCSQITSELEESITGLKGTALYFLVI